MSKPSKQPDHSSATSVPANVLGWSIGLRATTSADMIGRVERGFSIAALEKLRRRLGLSAEQLAKAVGTSPRTLARRKKSGRLEVDESDRVYRLVRLFERAVVVFGGGKEGEEDARRWFHLPLWALGEATPLDYARTDPGAREIEAVLDRIDYGVLG